ncbi:CHRD domain-containing protein [Alkalicoccus chagannorensis]|uniref:CHRD domain-containing protein n=1 Tax=Alkalicoccus chagannorensis TaxID=427072 RepID=UPI0004088905|nr:CHRD domain-containing protein [Alkalicoccus chagannorensis]
MKKAMVLSLAGAVGFAGAAGTVAADSHDHDDGTMFEAEMTPDQEVHDVDSDAHGEASFTLNDDQDEVSYTLEVHDLTDVTMAHIHSGAEGEDGPVEVDFLGEDYEVQDVDGELASGTFGEDDLAGDMSWDELLEAMTDDMLYVNVHTEEYPDGEIRGQIMAAADHEGEDDYNNEMNNNHDDNNYNNEMNNNHDEDNYNNEMNNHNNADNNHDEEGNEMAATASNGPLYTMLGMLAAMAGGAMMFVRRRTGQVQ